MSDKSQTQVPELLRPPEESAVREAPTPQIKPVGTPCSNQEKCHVKTSDKTTANNFDPLSSRQHLGGGCRLESPRA
jgi:hypothetical protein